MRCPAPAPPQTRIYLSGFMSMFTALYAVGGTVEKAYNATTSVMAWPVIGRKPLPALPLSPRESVSVPWRVSVALR